MGGDNVSFLNHNNELPVPPVAERMIPPVSDGHKKFRLTNADDGSMGNCVFNKIVLDDNGEVQLLHVTLPR
jgi:hypothetical protein